MSNDLGAIHDVAEVLARTPAHVANVAVLPAGGGSPEHVHANPYLWLHVLGSYRDSGDAGPLAVSGPSAMFFPAGSAHEMAVGARGLVSIIVEFDAARLRHVLGLGADLERPRHWIGGAVGREAATLARAWMAPCAAAEPPFAATEAFLSAAMDAEQAKPGPAWLGDLDALIDADERPHTERLARALGVSPPWLARAYRSARGEGLAESLRRRRVETAALLLERDAFGLAEIALEAGFCDQSHMIRGFHRHLGRTPAALRSARLGLAGAAPKGPPAGRRSFALADPMV
ncbi:MAG TPA: helix-turn-helix transcriptional regulator [Caulobacteraceae bacterium]|nr:helix-turn-helix transcriptional regulator [Caulobacteraceae bacterium]